MRGVDGEQTSGDARCRGRGRRRARRGWPCRKSTSEGSPVEVEREGLELLVERRGGVVAGAGDAAAVEVDGGEGLEDVVELGGGEVDGDGLVAGDAAGVLEEAYAVFVEGDAGDGELGVMRVRRGVLLADRNFLGGGMGAGRLRWAWASWGGEG